jgi:hypothetical protein
MSFPIDFGPDTPANRSLVTTGLRGRRKLNTPLFRVLAVPKDHRRKDVG